MTDSKRNLFNISAAFNTVNAVRYRHTLVNIIH